MIVVIPLPFPKIDFCFVYKAKSAILNIRKLTVY